MERKKEKKKKKKKKKKKLVIKGYTGQTTERNAGKRVPVSRREGEALLSADPEDREFEVSIPPPPRLPTARGCNK